MNIHEYQAKALLKSYGAPVAEGVAIFSADEAEAAAKSLPGPLYVVKSQIHAGGRGKGKFKELGPDAKGGVRLSKSVDEVVANAKEMLGNTLVTAQTGPAGKQVNRLYIEDGADIDRELYLSLLVGLPVAALVANSSPAPRATNGTTADHPVGRRVNHVSRWSAMALRYAKREDAPRSVPGRSPRGGPSPPTPRPPGPPRPRSATPSGSCR